MVGLFDEEEYGPQDPRSRAAIQAECSHKLVFRRADGVDVCECCGLIGDPHIKQRGMFTRTRKRRCRGKEKSDASEDGAAAGG